MNSELFNIICECMSITMYNRDKLVNHSKIGNMIYKTDHINYFSLYMKIKLEVNIRKIYI